MPVFYQVIQIKSRNYQKLFNTVQKLSSETINQIKNCYLPQGTKFRMKETFVNNVEELITANQNHLIKINYLESQKQKRQEYLIGLKQSIALNKKTLLVLNEEGPNDAALQTASKENQNLIKINQILYTQNRQLNALLLLEQQLRIEQKSLNLERASQFESRIFQLRKYLHDKEESFSAVIARLKKYEQWNEKALSEKIQDTEGMKKITNQILTQVTVQRNMYKAKYQQTFLDAQRFQLLIKAFSNPTNLSRFVAESHSLKPETKPNSQCSTSRQLLSHFSLSQQKAQCKKQQKPSNVHLKQNQMVNELIRLFKKEKLNNQILESALNSAIEKNQQLLQINQNLETALVMSQKKTEKLIAQNYFYKQRIKEFDFGYGKKYRTNQTKQVNDQPWFQDLLKLKFQIKDQNNEVVSKKIYKNLLLESFRQDIQNQLRIPISSSINLVMKNHCKAEEVQRHCKVEEVQRYCKAEEVQRMSQRTTNQNTELSQKIYKFQAQGEFQKQINIQEIERQNRSPSKMMIKSASQPRPFIHWQYPDEQYQQDSNQEQMAVEEF